MRFLNSSIILKINMILFFVSLVLVAPAFSKVVTQFTPSLSITEEYTDNYNQTKNNKEDEFATIYGAEFSFGIIDKNASLFLNYSPEYTDQADQNEDDSWNHIISLDGQSQVSKNTNLTFSEVFVRDLNRTSRTNSLEKHDVNTTLAGIRHAFGASDALGANYTFSFDDYENPNVDEYTTHNPSAFLSYWFTPQFGMDLNASYVKTKFETSTGDTETWTGNIIFSKSMTRHFDTYISYAHTSTKQASLDYTIYNPSVGFDWQPTEDMGINLGIGVLLMKFDSQYLNDMESLFFALDAYKTFEFSRKGTLSITGSSGYTSTSMDAASLGFEIYYEAGALLSYRLTRRLTSELNASYQINQFDMPGIDRQDNTLGLGGGLVWAPLQWLTLNLSYSFTDFDTDAGTRDDYQENVGMFTVRVSPERPVRFRNSTPRAELEDRLFE